MIFVCVITYSFIITTIWSCIIIRSITRARIKKVSRVDEYYRSLTEDEKYYLFIVPCVVSALLFSVYA